MIQKFVADYYNLKLADLKSRNNSKSVAMPRQIAMYLCKALTHASLPEIGRSFGGKHHSTVIHSMRKVEDLRKKDADFNTLIGNFLRGLSVGSCAGVFDVFDVFHRAHVDACGGPVDTRTGPFRGPNLTESIHVFCTS